MYYFISFSSAKWPEVLEKSYDLIMYVCEFLLWDRSAPK